MHLVARLIIASCDVSTYLAAGLGEDVGDSTKSVGGIPVTTCTE